MSDIKSLSVLAYNALSPTERKQIRDNPIFYYIRQQIQREKYERAIFILRYYVECTKHPVLNIMTNFIINKNITHQDYLKRIKLVPLIRSADKDTILSQLRFNFLYQNWVLFKNEINIYVSNYFSLTENLDEDKYEDEDVNIWTRHNYSLMLIFYIALCTYNKFELDLLIPFFEQIIIPPNVIRANPELKTIISNLLKPIIKKINSIKNNFLLDNKMFKYFICDIYNIVYKKFNEMDLKDFIAIKKNTLLI